LSSMLDDERNWTAATFKWTGWLWLWAARPTAAKQATTGTP